MYRCPLLLAISSKLPLMIFTVFIAREEKKTHAMVAGNISARINGRAMKQQQDF